MPNNLSDYLADALLDHLTGRVSFAAPTDTYLALYVVAPTSAGGGTEVAVANGYIRQIISWGAAASEQIASNADIRFPAGITNATGSWGTIVAAGIHDQISGGNLLLQGLLSAPIVIDTGDAFKITSGGLTIALT